MARGFMTAVRAAIALAKYSVAVVGTLLLAKAIIFPDYIHRYRLGIEVDTPDGLKQGANVIEVKRSDERWILIANGKYTFRIRGDAVFLDLGHGKNITALLAHGPRAEDVDTIIGLGIEAFLSRAERWNEDAWVGRKHLEGVRILGRPLIPTLVTFDNLDDPRTARIVDPDVFEAKFGAGYVFHQATVEMISVRVWPLNWLAITNPGVTRTIQQKLPWWERPLPWVRQALSGIFIDGRPVNHQSYRLQKEHFRKGV